jgi:hypothetical protein
MRLRETLLGLVVLGLVLGGVFWTRQRALPPASSDSAGRAAADAAVPDVTVADGTVDLGDIRVTLSVTPRPPEAFAKHRYRVRVESGALPLALEGGRISFEMAMPMGEHRYALVPADEGWQEAEVVLPFCQSGNRRWYATVEGTVAGRPTAVGFRLDLTPPGSASP